ncbi:MAG: hypothetical protein SF029_16240 [bacterium]|nr:hypothetical protein [bacterium]
MAKRAETVAEAIAQVFTIPDSLDGWGGLAGLIDGYKIAQELGFELIPWGSEQEARWRQTGRWNLDVLELRLMLFYQERANYFGGYTYHERDEQVESLLNELREKPSNRQNPPSG